MNPPSDAHHAILLKALEHFETQILSLHNRQEVVRFFCLQVIPSLIQQPLLLPLWDELHDEYKTLVAKTTKHESDSISEIKEAFRQVERDLKVRPAIPKELMTRLGEARSVILKDNFRTIMYPLYRIYDEEFRTVLQLLLKAGYRDICEKHAQLIDLERYVQKDPAEKERWGILNEQGKFEQILLPDEVSEFDKLHNPRYIRIHPETILVKIAEIHFYTYSPSASKAWTFSQQSHWDQFQNPAVVWRYFEAAFLCWNTPASCFEQQLVVPKTSDKALQFWRLSAEYSTWREISRAKERDPQDDYVVIFTEQFFKKGFKTLISAVLPFLAQGPRKPGELPVKKISFELFWHCDELWISIGWPGSTERLCLQKFNNMGYSAGSDPYQFCKKIVECARDGAIFPQQIKFDRVAHTINRMKLPKTLKNLYFGTTRKNSVSFQGPKLLMDAETANQHIGELREIHQSNGCPEFM